MQTEEELENLKELRIKYRQIEFVIENFLTMKTLHVDGYISKFYQLFKEEKNINAAKTLRDQGKTEYFLNPFMKQLHLVLKTQQRYHKQKKLQTNTAHEYICKLLNKVL